MVDQGSGAKVMYPNLYWGLGLTQKDLSKYDTPLVTFDGTVITPVGQIQLPVVVSGNKVLVDIIAVHSYSPYTAILGHLWIHSTSKGEVPHWPRNSCASGGGQGAT